jgi:hypothetical protein
MSSGRADSEGGDSADVFFKQVSRTTLIANVMFPVCVVYVTLCYVFNLSG